MANITITIPDAALSRVLDGIATAQNYSANQLPAETKAAFAKRMVIRQVLDWVTSTELSAIVIADTTAKQQDLAANVQIT